MDDLAKRWEEWAKGYGVWVNGNRRSMELLQDAYALIRDQATALAEKDTEIERLRGAVHHAAYRLAQDAHGAECSTQRRLKTAGLLARPAPFARNAAASLMNLWTHIEAL